MPDDFVAQERAEVQKLLAETGAPARPSPPSGQPPRQPEPNQNVQQPQNPPQQADFSAGQQQESYGNVPGGLESSQTTGDHQTADQQQNRQPGPPPGVLEERDRRRRAEQQLSETRQQQQRLSDRLDMINSVIQAQQQQRLDAASEPQLPDPAEDLQGYVQGLNSRYEREINQIRQQNDAVQAHLSQRQLADEIRQRAGVQAQAFAAENPDFQQAYHFYRAARTRDLESQGFDPATVAQAIEQEEMNTYQAHLQAGRNVAEAVYNAAKARGWGQQAPQQQQPQQPQYAQPQQQQAQPMYVNQAPPVPPQQQQAMQTMQAGMMAGQTLADASQTGGAVPMSLEAYANMGDDEFAAHMDSVKKLLGGV